MVDIDPVAVLRCWPVDVEVGGQTYTIPAMPAREWLVPILEGTWLDIVPGMLGGDAKAEELRDRLVGGTVPYEECKTAAKEALAVAAGTRRFWTARELARAAMVSWVVGDLIVNGVDLDQVSLAAFLAAAYRTATVNMKQSDRDKFDMDLDRPPRGVPVEEWFDEEEASQGFLDAMGVASVDDIPDDDFPGDEE